MSEACPRCGGPMTPVVDSTPYCNACEDRALARSKLGQGNVPRWHAKVLYRMGPPVGSVAVEHDFEELAELHDLVERGPHWDTIEKIEITLARPSEDETLTVEEAARR